MLKHTLFLLLFISFSFALKLKAQNLNTKNLNAYFDKLQTENRFMGTVAISQKGKILYNYTVGFANRDNKKKANNKNTYGIGSISKTFTAVLVLKAIEEGKLNLETPLSHFYAQIPNAEHILIKNLLNHTSGIFNFTDSPKYLSFYTKPKTRLEVINFIASLGTSFEVGSKHGYSNSNYFLLTCILENIYKQPYDSLLAEKITKPLKLKNTYLHKENDKAKVKSYFYAGTWILAPSTDYSIPMGAGAILSTSKDLATFGHALFNDKLISNASIELMKTFDQNYGLGLFKLSAEGIGHTGGIDGFSSIFSFFEKGDMAFVIISNGMNYSMEKILFTLQAAAKGEKIVLPTFDTITLNDEEIKDYIGLYQSKDLPLDIMISAEKGNLIAQAIGQSPFVLEAVSKTEFKYDLAGIVLIFDMPSKTMTLKQAGQTYTYTKL